MPRKVERFSLPERLHPLLDACNLSRLAATEKGGSTWMPDKSGGTNVTANAVRVPRKKGHERAIEEEVLRRAPDFAASEREKAAELRRDAEDLEDRARAARSLAVAADARAARIEQEVTRLTDPERAGSERVEPERPPARPRGEVIDYDQARREPERPPARSRGEVIDYDQARREPERPPGEAIEDGNSRGRMLPYVPAERRSGR